MYSATTAFQKVNNLSKKIRVIPGGTSASKTISVLLYLIGYAQTDKEKTLTSVVSESIPHLKRGAMRDFKNIMLKHGYWKDSNWNATDSIYTFETGSQIEFFSTDSGDKLRGARRDRCFMNEANNCTFDAFEQLEVRTKEFFILDFNPTNEFWAYTELKNRTDVEWLTLTYKDNEALDKAIVDSIEQRKDRKGWWAVYGLGQLGEVDGKIYKDWAIIDELPHEARLERYGMDFGYTNDPTAIVAIYKYNGGYILDEVAFTKGLSNKQIADILLSQNRALVIADSAEPKSIAEIASYGISIVGADKGPDSVRNGISLVQDQRISITKNSTNIIKEYRNYLWDTDKNGKILNVPESGFDHCFAPETLIYTTKGKIRIDELVGEVGYLYTKNGGIERFHGVKETRQNADVVSIEFDSGDVLTVTPDHLVLMDNGEWVEAGLLRPQDMIQSGIYETKANIRWEGLFSLQWREVFFKVIQEVAQSSLGVLQWFYTKWVSYTSQRWGLSQQQYQEPRNEKQGSSFERTYDGGAKAKSERVDKSYSTVGKEVAWVKRGEGVAQVTWSEDIRQKRTSRERLCSLPQEIYNNTVLKTCKILSSKLQNESTYKKVTGITRGFRDITYNLEVENTHCLIANGVVAHNSMDALRYGLSQLIKVGSFDGESERADRLMSRLRNTANQTK